MRTEALSEEAAPARSDRIEALYRTHSPDAFRLAYLLTGDRQLAEDLVQDAFVRVLGRFHDIRSPDAFWWYLRRTLVNLSRSHFRRRRVERAYLERGVDPKPESSTAVEDRDEVGRALRILRPEQRAALVLRFYEDLSEAEIGEILQCPVGTVKSMTARGVARLREVVTR